MEVTVESITGRRTILNNVDPLETVRNIKTKLWRQDGVPVSQQSLVYRSQALDDERTLKDYQVVDGAVLKLILITRSGPINKRVEFLPKKQSAVNGSENPNLPCASFGDGSRHPLDSNAPSTSSSTTIRRYTRQQMRQAQLATSQYTSKGNYANHLRGDTMSSDLEQQSSSSLLDLTFTPERQLASARRADENLRTMQRMRELRRSIERLNLEKIQLQKQAQQRNSGQGATGNTNVEAGQSRSRRPTGGSGTVAGQGNGTPAFSTGTQKSRSSTQILVSSSDRHSAAAAAARAAYAADDTSAKESSAGETEIEDTACFRQLAPSSTASNASNKQSMLNVPTGTKTKGQTSAQQLIPPPGFKSKQQLYRNIRRSSCSDVDVESSAVWSSDADADAVFRNDRSREELYTADDWSLDEANWNVASGRQDDQKTAQIIDSSDDYEDATADYEPRSDEAAQFAQMDEQNSSSGEDDTSAVADGLGVGGVLSRSGGHDMSSDPSELSSGVVICELSMAMNNRRMKVKRKSYHTPRHTNKRPQAVGIGTPRSAAIDETDDQSPLESPVKYGNISDAGRLFSSRFYHHNAPCRDNHHMHAGYFPGSASFSGSGAASRNWHRGRPRSKQRLMSGSATAATVMDQQATANLASSNGQQAMANNSTTTGESSSDEREDSIRRDSQGNLPTPVPTPGSASNVRSTGHGHKPPQSSQSQQRCNACACRLSVATTFQCRCGKTVCLRHRHADLHSCTLLAAAAVSEKK